MNDVEERVSGLDWKAASSSLTDSGFAQIAKLISAQECADLVELYSREQQFRSRIEMAKFRFGRGEYKYFGYPLPPLVEQLRHALYSRLVDVANSWAELLGDGRRFPQNLDELLKECWEHGQKRPTPLMLKYEAGDFNCLHQDLYGDIAFPFQVVVFLSQPDVDYSGGEFLLTEQIPRAQTMGRALRPQQGDALIITTRHRPGVGKRGAYKVTVRHGVSPVTWGHRWTLGLIFHDAQ